MKLRAITVIILTLLLFCGKFAHADGAPTLPSRKASVVLPLLDQLKPQASAKVVLKRLKAILGESDFEDAGGPIGRLWDDRYYRLDDKTQVIMQSVLGVRRLTEISIAIAGQDKKILYSAPEPRADANRTTTGD